MARDIAGEGFLEVHVAAPLDVCEQRDPKGLYKKARAGEIKDFTGIDAPYEEPRTPDIRLDTGNATVEDCTAQLTDLIKERFKI